MSALETLVTAYERPPVPETGVVGYVGDDVPRELVAAAGLHPLRLDGSGAITERADEILGPGVDAPVRSVLAGLLDGWPRLDFLLVSHESDATVRLFTALRVLAWTEPLPELWFLDLLRLPTETTARYNRDRLDDLLAVLERWSGEPVRADRVQAATREAGETLRLLDEVAGLRRASPPRLRGSDALAIRGACAVLPAVEANRLLEQLLAETREPLAEPARRLYVTGSAQAGPGLYRALESRGFHVAGEDMGIRRGPTEHAVLVAREARAAGADVVLAWIRSGDDARAWGIPALRRALDLPLVVLDRRDGDGLTDDDVALLR